MPVPDKTTHEGQNVTATAPRHHPATLAVLIPRQSQVHSTAP